MTEIIIAEHSGFCFGVKRAIDTAYKTVKGSKNKKVYVLGEIIHNPKVVNELSNLGVEKIEKLEEIKKTKKSILIIRSHGVSKKILAKSEKLGIEVVDTTCPFVKKLELIIDELIKENYKIIVLGDKFHPEISSLNDSFDNKLLIVESLEELENLGIQKSNRIALLSQTTQSLKKFRDCVNYLVDKCLELRIFNTICKSTEQRQLSSLELAKNADVIFVVGGKNSANTRRLYEICKNINSSTYHIEDETEIKKKYLQGKKKIGITAGASTPQDTINEIVKKLEKMIN